MTISSFLLGTADAIIPFPAGKGPRGRTVSSEPGVKSNLSKEYL